LKNVTESAFRFLRHLRQNFLGGNPDYLSVPPGGDGLARSGAMLDGGADAALNGSSDECPIRY